MTARGVDMSGLQDSLKLPSVQSVNRHIGINKRGQGKSVNPVCPRCGGKPHLTKSKIKHGDYLCLSCYRKKRKIEYGSYERKLHRSNYILRWRTSNKKHCNDYSKKYADSIDWATTYIEYIKKYPEKRIAKVAFRTAIRNGKLVRQPCVKCGNPKSQGHHEDYSKPLDVIWLCQPCHGRQHSIRR